MSKGLDATRSVWKRIDSLEQSERSGGERPYNSLVVDGAVTVVFMPQLANRVVVAGSTLQDTDSIQTRACGDALLISRTHVDEARLGRGGWGWFSDQLKTILGWRQREEDCQQYEVIVGVGQRFAPNIVHSGSGSVYLANLDQHHIDVEIAGSASVLAHGRVRHLQVVILGSGEFGGRDLESLDASLAIQGSGSIKVEAQKSVRSTVAGSGAITVFGSPASKEKSISGSGSVKYA